MGLILNIHSLVCSQKGTNIHCDECKLSLISSTHKNSLTDIKNRGYLTKSITDVETICNVTENIFRPYTKQIHSSNSHNFFLVKVKTELYRSYNIFSILNCGDDAWFGNYHKNNMVNLIVMKYLDIRMYYEVMIINE